MSDTVEATLPESFYQSLEALSNTITEGFAKLTENQVNSKDFLNPLNEVNKSTFIYDSSEESGYKKFGKAFITGGVEAFFDYYKKIKKQFDYTAVKKDIKQALPIINIDIPKETKKDEQPSGNFLNAITKGLLIGIAALGVLGGTETLGQLVESAAYFPKFFKGTLLDSGWRIQTFKSLANWAKDMTKPFAFLGKIGDGITEYLKPVSDSILKGFAKFKNLLSPLVKIKGAVSFLAKPFSFIGTIADKMTGLLKGISSFSGIASKSIGGLGGYLLKAASTFTKPLGLVLKRLPLIGTALGFYQAYLRFENGEIFQGVLEIAAAIASLLPGPGTAIALGINAMQFLIDKGDAGYAAAIKVGITTAKTATKFLPKLTSSLFKLLKPLGFALKRIPLLGSIINFGTAIYNFMNGSTTAGIVNVISGLVGLLDLVVPGLGSILSFAIDVIAAFIIEDKPEEESESVKDKESSGGISKFFSDIWDFIVNGVKKIGEWIWGGIKSLLFGGIGGWLIDLFFNAEKENEKNQNEFTGPEITGHEIIDWIKNTWDWVGNKVKAIKEKFKNIAKNTWNWVKGLFSDNKGKEPQVSQDNSSIKEVKQVTNEVTADAIKQIQEPQVSQDNSSIKEVKQVTNEVTADAIKQIQEPQDTSKITSNIIDTIKNFTDSAISKVPEIYNAVIDNIIESFGNINEVIDNEINNIISNFNSSDWFKSVTTNIIDKIKSNIENTQISDVKLDKRLQDINNVKLSVNAIDKEIDNIRGVFNKNVDNTLRTFDRNQNGLNQANQKLINAILSVREAIINRPLSKGNNIMINSGQNMPIRQTSSLDADPRLAYT